MKNLTNALTILVQVVTFLFAAFGGFLKKIAPPDQADAGYSVGIGSFLALIVLMILTVLRQDKPGLKQSKIWLYAGILLFLIAASTSFLYSNYLDAYTFPHDTPLQARQLSAPDAYLTPDARRYKTQNPQAAAEDLNRNLPDGDIWTPAGLTHAKMHLLVCYLSLVLSIAGSIFCLLQANKLRVLSASPAMAADRNHGAA